MRCGAVVGGCLAAAGLIGCEPGGTSGGADAPGADASGASGADAGPDDRWGPCDDCDAAVWRPSLDAEAGQVLWESRTASQDVIPGVAFDGTSLALVIADSPFILDMSGRTNAMAQTCSRGRRASPMFSEDGLVLVSADDLCAFDSQGGRDLVRPLGSAANGAIWRSHMLLASTSGGRVVAVDTRPNAREAGRLYPQDTVIAWWRQAAETGAPVIALLAGWDNTLAVAVDDGTVRRMDVLTGDAAGSLAICDGEPGDAATPLLAGPDGVIFARSRVTPDLDLTRTLVSCDWSGRMRWRTPDGAWSSPHAILPSGATLVAEQWGRQPVPGPILLRVVRNDGASALAGEVISQSPSIVVDVVIGADGMVYVLTEDRPFAPGARSQVVALRITPAGLVEAWRRSFTDRRLLTGPALTGDGKLVVAGEVNVNLAGIVTAIQTGSPGLAGRGWPAFRADNARTAWFAPGP